MISTRMCLLSGESLKSEVLFDQKGPIYGVNPNPPLTQIFTKRFRRGEVELGTMFNRSKLYEKPNILVKKHRCIYCRVYIISTM